LNKIQLKIKKIEFFLLGQTQSNTFRFGSDPIRPWTIEMLSTIYVNCASELIHFALFFFVKWTVQSELLFTLTCTVHVNSSLCTVRFTKENSTSRELCKWIIIHSLFALQKQTVESELIHLHSSREAVWSCF